MSALMARVRGRAEARADNLRREAAELLGEALPGARIDIEGEAIRLSGRGLRRRWDGIGADHLLRSHWP